MAEQTPADVIARDRAARRMRSNPDSLDHAAARDTLAVLKAAGFEVRPRVDADTRAEAARLIERYEEWIDAPSGTDLCSSDLDLVIDLGLMLDRLLGEVSDG